MEQIGKIGFDSRIDSNFALLYELFKIKKELKLIEENLSDIKKELKRLTHIEGFKNDKT